MKIFASLFFVLAIGMPCLAERTNTIPDDKVYITNQTLSEVRSNLFVVLLDKTSANPVEPSTDLPIEFGIMSNDGTSYNICILRPEYGYRISATSKTGKPVERTEQGRLYGQKFDDVKGYDKDTFDTTWYRGDRQRPYWTMATPHFPATRKLPALDRLFKFDAAGEYTVRLEIQVIGWPLGRSSTNAYAVRFPAVKFKILPKAKK
jgi:hypothetical protein